MNPKDNPEEMDKLIRDKTLKAALEAEQRKFQERRSGEDRRNTPAPNVPSPDHLGELMALAATVRQCQRNGHPDLSKHLEALLTKLGA